MDRGLGNYYRGNGGGNVRREDRRYDDFYADRDRRGAASFRGNRSGGSQRGGGSRDRGFFGNQGNQNNVIAALQLQNQNLLSAYIRNQSRGNVFQHQQQQRKGYNQGSSFRPGDKRRQESSGASGFNKRPKQSNNDRSDRRSSSASIKSDPKKEAPKKEEPKEILPEIPDDKVEIPDNLMDNVEKLRQRKDIDRNVADEDIEKLLVFSFNGKGYDCLTCGFMLMKDVAFRNHITSKSHVMKVIEARSDKKYQSTRDLLEIDLSPDGWFEKSETAKKVIIKQARLMMKIDMDKKKRDLDNYNRDPKNFFSVNMSSMKSATMTGDTVRITSVVESTIDVKEFSNNRFFGCEFVKTVSSFQCRLCDIKIHNASEVLAHIDSRVHRNKYQMHLKRYPEYESKQKDQNKELGAILQEHEGQAVLLSETTTNKSTDDGQGKTVLQEIDPLLIRVPEILNPPPKEEPKTESKEDKSKESEESTTTDETTTTADEEKKEEEKVKDEPVEPMETESAEASTTPSISTEEKANVATTEKVAESKEDKSAEETTNTAVTESIEANQEAEDMKEEESSTYEKVVEEEKKTEEIPMVSPLKAEPKPKKSILKKGTTKTRGGSARRGTPRGKRGGKTASASPKTPSTPASTKDEATPSATEEPSVPAATDETRDGEEDGSFMDGFQIVDEVKDD